MAEKHKVRVRLAPSPTGEVHIGTIWLAMFNWLFARQAGGSFILRIEDTDQKRLVAGAAERLFEALEWYGLRPDEGPQQGGALGPYIQSQRLPLYQQYAQQLVDIGQAYYCFCTPERLAALRQEQEAAKLPPRYDKHCAALDAQTVAERRGRGESSVIRLHVPTHGTIAIEDTIRGTVTFRFDQLDDSVLLKSDGFPTYHLAVVVDDHLMEITHVIRGEEWLSSAPKHQLLYQALGWTPPSWAHLPLILGPHKRKLSKREGAAAALHYRDQGYLPEAMRNFLVLMGWHPKGDKEILTLDEMLAQFRLDQVNPSGAVFDQQKLDWLNGAYIRSLPLIELRRRLEPFWHHPTESLDSAKLDQAVRLVQDRLSRLDEIDGFINFIFPSVWDAEVVAFPEAELIPKKGSRQAVTEALQWVQNLLNQQPEPWQADSLRTTVIEAIQTAGRKNLAVLWPLRVALTLRQASPDVFDIASLLGPEETLRRIKRFLPH